MKYIIMSKILIIDADESFGFRFARNYGNRDEIQLLYPLKGIENFLESLMELPDNYDFIINNFDIPFYSKSTNYLEMNFKVQEFINERFHAGKKVLLSSQLVYSSSTLPKNENYKTIPETEYGKTKIKAEQAVKQNDHYLIIRRGMTYGKCTYNIYTDILTAIRSKMPVKLNNNIILNPVLNSDLSLIVDKIMKNMDRQIINVASDEAMTLYEFGSRLYGSVNDDTCPFIKTYTGKNLDYRMDMSMIHKLYNLEFTGLEDINFMDFLPR